MKRKAILVLMLTAVISAASCGKTVDISDNKLTVELPAFSAAMVVIK